jgi:hypothetical protein
MPLCICDSPYIRFFGSFTNANTKAILLFSPAVNSLPVRSFVPEVMQRQDFGTLVACTNDRHGSQSGYPKQNGDMAADSIINGDRDEREKKRVLQRDGEKTLRKNSRSYSGG